MNQCGKCKNFNKSKNKCAVRGTFHKSTDVGINACRDHFEEGEPFVDDDITIREPKVIARIKLCGGGLTFTITDIMQFEMPTKEQCENLKKTFGIEVEMI